MCIRDSYTPKQVNEGEWDYDLKLYGVESLIKRFLVLETTDGDTNPRFTPVSYTHLDVYKRQVCSSWCYGMKKSWRVSVAKPRAKFQMTFKR